MTLAGFGILLLLAPLKISLGGGNRGNCTFLSNSTFKLACHGYVSEDLYNLYRDKRAPKNTPFGVWQSEVPDDSDDLVVLVTFHDNYLHNFESLRIENYAHADTVHSFEARSDSYLRRISYSPSLLYCFPISLRYPMELRSHCLGIGRSTEVAKKPVLFYAMEDFKEAKRAPAGANRVIPFRALLVIVLSALLVVVA